MFLNESTLGVWARGGAAALPVVYVSLTGASHRALLELGDSERQRLSLVVGSRPEYDALLRPAPERFTLEGLAAPRPAWPRRLLVSAQRRCLDDDLRLLEFLARFIAVDVFGACAPRVTWNTWHARERLQRQGAEDVVGDYELALISDAGAVGDRGAGAAEEVWAALRGGAVPVGWGAGLATWLPDPGAAIDAAAFATPMHLAVFLQALEADRSKLDRFHAWRGRPRTCEVAPRSLCRALAAQAPAMLSWDATVSLVSTRLRRAEVRSGYLTGSARGGRGGIDGALADRAWRLACGGLLPRELRLRRPSVDGLRFLSEGPGGVASIEAQGEALELRHAAGGVAELLPRTPRLAQQLQELGPLLANRGLFEGRAVLHLGLTPIDALPLAGLAAWRHGGARSVVVHAPEASLQGLSDLAAWLEASLGEPIMRLAVQDDFRQRPSDRHRGLPPSVSSSMWLEAGLNEFLQGDTVLALGSTVRRVARCLGLDSVQTVASFFRHLSRETLIVEWSDPCGAEGDGFGGDCSTPHTMPAGDLLSEDTFVAALRSQFAQVTLVLGGADRPTAGASNVYVCLGPDVSTSAWSMLRISDPLVPVLTAGPDDVPMQELAMSGFTWAGEAMSKRVLRQGGKLVKVTSSLMALKEAFFLDLFAPRCACTPRLIDCKHDRAQDGKSLWSMVHMDFVEGQDLEAHLAEAVKSADDVRDLLLAVVDLLECLASRGVQHNDLWASNLRVQGAADPGRRGGGLRLVAIDFGAARLRLPGGLSEDDIGSEDLPGSGAWTPALLSAVRRGRAFLARAGARAADFPPLAPSFAVDVGCEGVPPTSDRRMVAAMLMHKMFRSPANPDLVAAAAAPYRHVLEALALDGRRDGGRGWAGAPLEDAAFAWPLSAVRALILGGSSVETPGHVLRG